MQPVLPQAEHKEHRVDDAADEKGARRLLDLLRAHVERHLGMTRGIGQAHHALLAGEWNIFDAIACTMNRMPQPETTVSTTVKVCDRSGFMAFGRRANQIVR